MRYSLFSAFVFLLSFAFAESFALAETQITIRKIDESALDELIGAKNNRIVVDFMAAWCQPCIQELPDLNRLHNKYKNQGFNLIGISIDLEGPEAVQPILNQLGINFPVYWYGEKAIAKYNLTAIPMLLFVKQGIIVERLRGKPPAAYLDKKIRDFLK